MFAFKLNQSVLVKVSGEKGTVEARAEYAAGNNQYFVHYRAADGRAVTTWFDEHHLEENKPNAVCDCPVCSMFRPFEGVVTFGFEPTK